MPSDRIAKARQIVGNNEADDYILKPEMHAKMFADNAPVLAQALQSSTLDDPFER